MFAIQKKVDDFSKKTKDFSAVVRELANSCAFAICAQEKKKEEDEKNPKKTN